VRRFDSSRGHFRDSSRAARDVGLVDVKAFAVASGITSALFSEPQAIEVEPKAKATSKAK
jgi:hypothetical protein